MADRFDLDAIEADDALLDLLAAGGESARAAGEHDPALALLAELRLAVEVEDELPEESIDDPESFLARCAALNPITDPFARKVATRGLAFGVAAVAALSVSGVAAAVNGDPLSPYEKVIEKMVDAVRPQTSFPKEDLDGLPVVDRSKIVKVGKDFQDKTRAGHINSAGNDDPTDTPQAQKTVDPPVLPVLPVDKPMVATLPPESTAPTPPLVQQTQDDDEQTDPSATETTAPTDSTTTDAPTSDPTDAPTSAPTDEPSQAPSTPADPTTDPSGAPTTAPTDGGATTPPENVDNGSTNDGSSSDPTTAPGGDANGTDPNGSDSNSSDPSGNPTTAPSGDPTTGDTTTGDTTAPADGTTKPPAGETGGVDPSTDPAGTTTPGTDPVTSDLSAVPNSIGTVVDQIVDTVGDPSALPTPTGQQPPIVSAEQFFGKSGEPAAGKPKATAKARSSAKAKAAAKARATAKAKQAAAIKAAKHSSGKVSTGSVRTTYAKGKHSSGRYPEGKHAAIARTHGSTDDSSLLAILGIVNAPTDKRK
ncbi:MAG TPA: hypothetical protein VFH76_24075 [Kribbella sp.]|nr:hypothetical protein [Kribbella sp.]